MTNIFDVWEFINFVADKYRNGYLAPPEVSKALDQAQNTLWYNFLGKRQNGNELALVALKPFYKTVSVTSFTSGLVNYPNAWAETQAVYKNADGVTISVRQVLHDELQDALSSVIYPISANPRYLEQETGIQIYPAITTSVSWHYLSKPTTPVIGYTNSGNQVIYDPVTSVQLQFDTQYWNDIIALTLPYIGVNLSDQELAALSQTFSLNANVGDSGN